MISNEQSPGIIELTPLRVIHNQINPETMRIRDSAALDEELLGILQLQGDDVSGNNITLLENRANKSKS